MIPRTGRQMQRQQSLILWMRTPRENSTVTECSPLPAEVVKWKSSDGMEIYGVFRSVGDNCPVVVDVHGGPTSYSPITFMDRLTNLISSGFSVFSPNYRGSVGKGRAYAEANRRMVIHYSGWRPSQLYEWYHGSSPNPIFRIDPQQQRTC